MKKKNTTLPPVVYGEDEKLHVIWNAKPENKRGFWEKHEEKIFNGIQRGLEYICAGSLIAWFLYWIPIWTSK